MLYALLSACLLAYGLMSIMDLGRPSRWLWWRFWGVAGAIAFGVLGLVVSIMYELSTLGQ